MFDPVDPKQSFPELERGIQEYWLYEDVFKRSIEQRSSADSYTFYDGPPFATGLPHYGHLLAGTIKDVIPRYQTMRGRRVERRFGWDCHGLPIENLIEKEHNIASKQEIEERGVRWFNELCRSAVQRYTEEWRTVVERMGRWVDMDHDYRTMDAEYMESMWWAFAQLHEKGLIYEGYKPMHICPRCVTPLSNFEVTQGYMDITDQSVVAKFALEERRRGGEDRTTYVLAWTTTPWTLPGNLFLAVGKDIEYARVLHEGDEYILAADLVEKVFGEREYEVSGKMAGSTLVGMRYEPLFPYFETEYKERAFKVVAGDFVTTEEGTGVVHIATGFGQDDYEVGRVEFGPEEQPLQHVSMEGRFIDAVTDFAGMELKPKDDTSKTDRKVIDFLDGQGKVFDRHSYKHSYPHCWRCDTPLLNYTTNSWFVNIDKIKDKMLANKDTTTWVPHHIRDGRFGKWLEGARDWAISRNRYWGTPLPLWRTESGAIDVVDSRDALMQRALLRYTKISVLRHAESEGNRIPIYQGNEPGTDLTERGKTQADAAGTQLNAIQHDVLKPTVIYCSPLARTQQTANRIAEQTGATVVVDDRLRELSFGDYEGKTIDFSDPRLLRERREHKWKEGQPESIYHFAGMETWERVQERIESFYNEVIPRHRGEHIVVVTHADPVMNSMVYFTGMDAFKVSHRPYPDFAQPVAYYWDHERAVQMDLHKDSADEIMWHAEDGDPIVDLTLVRHGQTDVNLARKCQGSEVDVSLNDTGRDQAQQTADVLKKQSFDCIVTSDLKRARETAEILSEALNISIAEELPLLRERSMGEWSGQSIESIASSAGLVEGVNPAMYHGHIPSGESFGEFVQRLTAARHHLVEKYAGKRVLVVGHGGSFQVLRAIVDNRPYRALPDLLLQNAEPVHLPLRQLYQRIPDVLDCWFESGSMPYAQVHFPFSYQESHSNVPPGFPADFIAEGVDQTRAWFYTLMVLSTALFDQSPYEHVVVNGIVLAEDGKKMSKRLKNYPEPTEIVEKYGADAIRFTLMSSPAVRAEDLRISEKIIEETVRSVLLPLWNSYSFFVLHANAAHFEPVNTRRSSTHPLDQWMQAEMQDLVNRMTQQFDSYDLSATCSELHETIDMLTNWYVRLSRRRFAAKETVSDEERFEAMHTLYDVLLTLCQLLAPFCPFITDAIYLNLVAEEHGSIHLTDWPTVRALSSEEQLLLRKTRLQRLVVSLGMSVRSEHTIKVRQPLQSAEIAIPPSMMKGISFGEEDVTLLQHELNVKSLIFSDDPESLADVYVQVNARAVGPRLGKKVQQVIQAGKNGEFVQHDDASVTILDEQLAADEIQIVYRGKEGHPVASERGVVVSLDCAITEELEQEGLARDVVRAVQSFRKEQGLNVDDRIALEMSDDLAALAQTYGHMIATETTGSFESDPTAALHVIVTMKDGKVLVDSL